MMRRLGDHPRCVVGALWFRLVPGEDTNSSYQLAEGPPTLGLAKVQRAKRQPLEVRRLQPA